MDISSLSSAKTLIINLKCSDINSNACFTKNTLLKIRPAMNGQDVLTFLVKQYVQGIDASEVILCTTDQWTASYLSKILELQNKNKLYCVFLIIEVKENELIVQTFTFNSIIKYDSSINIIVSNDILGIDSNFDPNSTVSQIKINDTLKKFYDDYVWEGLGDPAIFYLNNNNRSNRKADLCLLGDGKFLNCQKIKRRILVEKQKNQSKNIPVVDLAIAPEIKFIKQGDVSSINDDFIKNISQLSTSASYIEHWDAYNELTKKTLEEDKENFGKLKYDDYKLSYDSSGWKYTFIIKDSLDDKLDDSDIGKPLCVIFEYNSEEDSKSSSLNPISVGTIQKITDDQIITLLETDDKDDIPEQGCLSLSTIGDEVVIKRREKARDRIIQLKSSIPNLSDLIESDTPQDDIFKQWGTNPPITEQLKKNFKKAQNLTPDQVEAVDIGINTPDIANIEGPPGTGKTTTIQAIVERFREVFEKEERAKQEQNPDYNPRSPKILISSFQNEAVDNAISATLPRDIPAYRKRVKSSEYNSESYEDTCQNWFEEYSSKLEKTIDNDVISRFLTTKQKLNDEFDSYRSSERPKEKAKELIKKYLDYDVDIHYPEHLKKKANEIIKQLSTKKTYDDTDPVLESFFSKIESLRTDKESFEDDGLRNVKKFFNFIQWNDEILSNIKISHDILKSIESVCKESFSPVEDNKKFQEYRKAVETLKKSIVKDETKKDDHPIDQCIRELADHFEKYYIDTLSLEDKTSVFLGEFLLNFEEDYIDVIQKYATRTGATCQASLDLNEDKEYDLVIVDEAARANPMDLLIPMSQAKKIILVGDQKQLPHMLEHDIIEQLAEDPQFKDIIPEIEKTLFERLFDKFLKGSHPKSILLTEQFRMHPDICNFVSECFYDGKLKTAKTIDLEKCSSPKEINNGKALTFVNIPISRGEETSGKSKSRIIEVEAIKEDIKHILKNDPKATIGVITFYSAQEHKIKMALEELRLDEDQKNNIKIGTVDAFQGKEFNYVLLSCVRSNSKKNVGFLEKPNRLCVAFSRAQKQLIVYGDAETLKQIPCFKKLYTICQDDKSGGNYREDRYTMQEKI